MPNNDYILRSDATTLVSQLPAYHGSEGAWVDQKDALDTLNAIPAADVEPKRKTGRWVYKHRTQVHYHKETGEDVMTGEKRTVMVYDDLSGKYPHCPYCDALAADSFMDYCPHCGAKMDAEPPKGENDEQGA